MSWKSWGVALTAAIVVGLGASIYAITPPSFTPERWRAEHDNITEKSPRIYWVTAVEQRIRPGMTKAEVTALLGEPESRKDNIWSYHLGASPYGVDYEYFNIEFDAADSLTRFFIERG